VAEEGGGHWGIGFHARLRGRALDDTPGGGGAHGDARFEY